MEIIESTALLVVGAWVQCVPGTDGVELLDAFEEERPDMRLRGGFALHLLDPPSSTVTTC